jgi:signal transduction histidine kinase
MTDAERVLSLLIHDLRTPLGVAHGYLRLIRADKLPAPEDRDRALAGTQDALGKISRLCQEAGAFLEGPPDRSGRGPAAALVERVEAGLAARGIPVTAPAGLSGLATVGISLDRAADAITAVLATRTGKGRPVAAAVAPSTTELVFRCGPDQAAGATVDGERPFDPWQGSHGLTVVLAHSLLIGLGGRVSIAADGHTIALAVPMESGAQ